MNAANESTLTSRKCRYWPRISLRTLLILVAVLGIGLGFIGNFWNNLQKKRHAIALVNGGGGRVHYSYQFGYDDDLRTPMRHFTTVSSREVDGRLERTITTSLGTKVDYAQPPGPRILRWFLGDNAFAHVNGIAFGWSDSPLPLEPQILAHFPELKVVWLHQEQMDPQWLKECASVSKLYALQLQGDEKTTVTGGDLAQFASAKELKLMGCSGDWVNDEIVAAVGKLQQLESVQILTAPNVTSAVFQDLAQLPELRSLDIIRCKGIDDVGGTPLAKLQQLHTLQLMYTSVGDRTMEAIGGLNNLECVFLSGTNVGDAGATHIAKLIQLKCLALDRTKITDEGVHALAPLKQLRILNLHQTPITDSSLTTIAQFSELESLSLSACPAIQSASFLQLRALTNLRSLRVGKQITEEDLSELKLALPNCNVYD